MDSHLLPSRILVPVDFSDASAQAVAVGAALAARVRGTLHVLHAEVLEVPPYFTHEQLKTLERERAVARTRAQEFLEDFARRQGAVQFTASVVEGPPTAEIVDAARLLDLVVMGTHGRRGPARWWLGSVAERVVHHSPVPVLVVRSGGNIASVDALFANPVLVAPARTDGDLVRTAAEGLAAAFGGHVADAIASCEADLSRGRGATLVVLSSLARHGLHPAEHWLRRCPLPMLFVPDAVSKPSAPESLNRATEHVPQGGAK